MLKRVYIVISVLVLGIWGCSDFLSSDDTSTNTIKIEVYSPKAGDSISFRSQTVSYSLVTASGVNYIELYVNDKFKKSFFPGTYAWPPITIDLDSTYINQTIKYHLIYYDKNGFSSKSTVFENIVVTEPRTAPTIPYDFNILRIDDNSVNLSWKDSSLNTNYYNIYRSTGKPDNFVLHLSSSIIQKQVNINDNEANLPSIYYYKIEAVNKFGKAVSVIKNSAGTGGSINIAAPTNLTARATDTRVVKLTWTDNSDNENYFKIERKDASSNFAEVGIAGINRTTFTDSLNGLIPNREYIYRVKAFSSTDSSWSNEVYITTPQFVLKAPTLLTITNTSSKKTTITWKDNDQYYANFEIERKTGNSGVFTKIDEVEGQILKYEDKNVTPSNLYVYRLRQVNGTDSSVYSNEISLFKAPVPLPAPTGVDGWFTGSAAYIHWDYTEEPNEFVILRKCIGVDAAYIEIARVPGTAVKEYNDYNTIAQKNYSYMVYAIDSYSTSPNSNEKTIKNWNNP